MTEAASSALKDSGKDLQRKLMELEQAANHAEEEWLCGEAIMRSIIQLLIARLQQERRDLDNVLEDRLLELSETRARLMDFQERVKRDLAHIHGQVKADQQRIEEEIDRTMRSGAARLAEAPESQLAMRRVTGR
jgi:predicted  nucleic acid-binding Zn-ribbon protein